MRPPLRHLLAIWAALGLLLWGASAWAAVSFGVTCQGKGAGASTTIATTACTGTPTAGSTMICAPSWTSSGGGVGTVTGLADSAGNTWTPITGGENQVHLEGMFAWTAHNLAVAGWSSVTATLSNAGSIDRVLICAEIGGALTTSTNDVHNWDGNGPVGLGTDAVTCGTGGADCQATPTQAGDMLVGILRRAATDSNGTTITAGTGWTLGAKVPNFGSGDIVHLEYQIQGAAATYHPTWTWDVAGTAGHTVITNVAIKAAPVTKLQKKPSGVLFLDTTSPALQVK